MTGPWWFPGFRWLAGRGLRASRRFTATGRAWTALMVLTAILGLDTQRTMIHQLFGWLMATFLLAWLFAWRFHPRCQVSRILPQYATVGETMSYGIRVVNLTGRPQRQLELLDDLVWCWPNWLEFRQSREPGEERRNWFDRWVGYPRYVWLVYQRRGAVLQGGDLGYLPARAEAMVEITLTPLRRGWLDFAPGVALARTDPLGLCRGWQVIPAQAAGGIQRLLVLPRRYVLPFGLQPDGGRRYQPGGVALASAVGDAEEFVALREFREGDSLRRIHWPSMAKLGKPMVKEFQQEYFVRHALVLDTMAVEREECFEEAVAIAASFAVGLTNGESLLDLLFVGTGAYRFTFGRGVGPAEQMLEILAAVAICRGQSFGHLVDLVMEGIREVSSVILVLTAWDWERRELVARLLAIGLPLLVLVVVAEEEGAELDPGPMVVDPQRFYGLRVGHIDEGLAKARTLFR